MSKSAVLTVFIFNHLFSSCHFQTLTASRESIQELNDKILTTADRVFISLRIDKNFTKQKRVAERLLIHDFIQNVSEKNHKKYKEIHNVSKTNVDSNKTAYFIFIINEVFEDIITRQINHTSAIALTVIDKSNNTNGFPVSSGLKVNFTDFNQKVLFIIKDTVFKLLIPSPKKSKHSGNEDLKQWVSNMTNILGSRRIFEGEPTSVENFPFMASVHIAGQFSCAGVILSNDFVITAASCLQAYDTAQMRPRDPVTVRVGSDFASRHGRLVPVTGMSFHPDYDHNSLANNLVILKVGKRLNFSSKIRKIVFDTKAHKLPENVDNIFILGWGDKHDKDNTIKTTPEPISYAYVEVYNLEDCKNIYSSFYVKDKHFCTGYVSKGSGACNNDIGGPAIVGSCLTGIISFGSPYCGRPDAPTVFTKVGYYAQWISNIIEGYQQPEDENKPKDIEKELDSLKQLIGEIEAQKHVNNSIDEIANEVKTKYLKRKEPLRSVIDAEPNISGNVFEPAENQTESAELMNTPENHLTDQSHKNIHSTPDLLNEGNLQTQDYGAEDKINTDNLVSVEEYDKMTTPNLAQSENIIKTTPDELDIQLDGPIDVSEIKIEDIYAEYETTPKRVQLTPSSKLKKISYSVNKPDQALKPIPASIDAGLEDDNYYDDYENVTGRDLFVDPDDDQNAPTATVRNTRKHAMPRTTTVKPLRSTKIGDELLVQMTMFSESESAENETSSLRPITPETKVSRATAKSPKTKDTFDPTRSNKNKAHKAARSNVEMKLRHKQGAINESGTGRNFEIVFWNGGTTRWFSEYPPNKVDVRKSIDMDSSETSDVSDVEY